MEEADADSVEEAVPKLQEVGELSTRLLKLWNRLVSFLLSPNPISPHKKLHKQIQRL